ncbi:MAG: hypothetical protein ABIH63_01160 [archaeon]
MILMKREYKNLVEKFELYKKFLEGRFIDGAFNPIKIEPDLTQFLRERYGDKIRGKRLEEMTKEHKYAIAKRETFNILRELSLDAPRERLLEGMLLVKQNPTDFGLYSKMIEALETASEPDLIMAFGGITSDEENNEQLTLKFQDRKTY